MNGQLHVTADLSPGEIAFGIHWIFACKEEELCRNYIQKRKRERKKFL
jgi:hypothetical protein